MNRIEEIGREINKRYRNKKKRNQQKRKKIT